MTVLQVSDRWRVSDINQEFGLCSSYPELLYTPSEIEVGNSSSNSTVITIAIIAAERSEAATSMAVYLKNLSFFVVTRSMVLNWLGLYFF